MGRDKLEVQDEINKVLEELKSLRERKRGLKQTEAFKQNRTYDFIVSVREPAKEKKKVEEKIGEKEKELRELKKEYARLQEPQELLPR